MSNSKYKHYLDQKPELGHRVYIDDSAVVIGAASIGDDSSIWPGAIIRADMHEVHVGKRTSIQDGAVLHVTHKSSYNPNGWPLTVGDDVTVGHQACLHGCAIGNEALIGIGAIVLDGAIIEHRVILGAGSLVPPGKTLESGFLYVGSPAKKIRPLTETEKSFFSYSAQNYVELKNHYLAT